MNKVPKVTFGCILAILVVVISGSYSMIQAQLQRPPDLISYLYTTSGQIIPLYRYRGFDTDFKYPRNTRMSNVTCKLKPSEVGHDPIKQFNSTHTIC